MPTATYDLIASSILTSQAASVTFSSLPTTFRDLIIVTNALVPSNQVDANIQFNGDTSNYTRVFMYQVSNTKLAGTGTDRQSFAPRTSPGTNIIQIFDYRQTDRHKSTLVRSDETNYITYTQASRWASTAAITSILLSPASGNWNTGATFHLYGVVA